MATKKEHRGLEEIPSWVAPALQGLTFWLGFQDARMAGSRISEGAMAHQLIQLMYAHRLPGRCLEAEVYYSDIPELRVTDFSRADIVISQKQRPDRETPYQKRDIEAIIEVKHDRSRKKLVWEDIDHLGAQRKKARHIRAFLIYASVNERPKDFTKDNGFLVNELDRDRVTPTKSKTAYRVRSVRRGLAKASEEYVEEYGYYAVLIEICPARKAK